MVFIKNNFHIFRQTKKLSMQDNFIFLDTEANTKQIDKDIKELTFRMGSAIFWNRKNDIYEKLIFYDTLNFWENVEFIFSQGVKEQILFSHNTQFDLKMIDGFNYLLRNGWEIKNQYVRASIFIFVFVKIDKYKNKKILHIWDTFNYVRVPLEKIGKSLNLPKLDIDLGKCNKIELEMYCLRDSEIIFAFIRQLIDFLIVNNLSKLKATSGSISFNAFRHAFYDVKDKPIYIHDWKESIKLERSSFRGGITDCFLVNKLLNGVYKLDINSMYSWVMKEYYFPTKLLRYTNESELSQVQLFELYNRLKNNKNYGFILDVSFSIPKENAYILTKLPKSKAMFLYGNNIRLSLCQPELDFIENKKNKGKISYIFSMNIYKMQDIFSNFVDVFFNFKLKYKKEKNKVNEGLAKLILNNLYGKFAQKDMEFKKISINSDFLIKYQDIIKMMIEKCKNLIKDNSIVYLGAIINVAEIYIINKELFLFRKFEKNSKESFVAISSFIISYARMLLIKYLKIAKRKNSFYCDTDSLFVNKKGYKKLKHKGLINEFTLGKLKNEGFGYAKFYNPKFYDFNEVRKCKGIKKKSVILYENENEVSYSMEQWSKLKTSLKEGNLDKQIIKTVIKTMNKHYNKGNVINHKVFPFNYNEI